jgi:hypothetical protein
VKLNIVQGNLDRLFEVCAELDSSKRWSVEISEAKTKRSLNQNALLYKWEGILADEQGLTKQEVHDHNKRYFYLPIYERDGYPYEDLPDLMATLRELYRLGEKAKAEQFHKFVVSSISTARADTKQTTEALKDIDKDAISRLQVALPQPGEQDET